MMARTDWPKAALTTEAMQILDAILREWCAENECDRESEQGRLTAKSLVDWFEFGVTERAELERLVRDDVTIDKPRKP